MDDEEILARLEESLEPPMDLTEPQIIESFFGLLAGARVIGEDEALVRALEVEYPDALPLPGPGDTKGIDRLADCVIYMNRWMKSLLAIRGLPFLAYWAPSALSDDDWRYWVVGDYKRIVEAFGEGFVREADGEYGFGFGHDK